MAAIATAQRLQCLAVGAALFAAATIFAQPDAADDEPIVDDALLRLPELIQEQQAISGPHDESLIELWSALGALYKQHGDLVPAVAAYEQALQIVRANYGIYSLEQSDLLFETLDTLESAGEDEKAWDLEQAILEVARRHPDDLRAVPILRKVADRQNAVLGSYLDGELPPQIVLGCYYDRSGRDGVRLCQSGSRRVVIRALRADTQRTYAEAIAVLLRNERFDSDELRELETRLVQSSDLVRSHDLKNGTNLKLPLLEGEWTIEPWSGRVAPIVELASWQVADSMPFESAERDVAPQNIAAVALNRYESQDHYELGRYSLRRMIEYELASGRPWPDVIRALVVLADWDLLYSRNSSAFRGYEEAYAQLEAAGVAQSLLDEIFDPATPVVLPTFTPSPLVAEQHAASADYIEIGFELTRYGQSRKVEVLETTANVTKDDIDDAIELVKQSRFRPKMTDGELARSGPAVVRYHVTADTRG